MRLKYRNLIVAPIVLFVRLPLLVCLALIVEIGHVAEWLSEVIYQHLPGFLKS